MNACECTFYVSSFNWFEKTCEDEMSSHPVESEIYCKTLGADDDISKAYFLNFFFLNMKFDEDLSLYSILNAEVNIYHVFPYITLIVFKISTLQTLTGYRRPCFISAPGQRLVQVASVRSWGGQVS